MQKVYKLREDRREEERREEDRREKDGKKGQLEMYTSAVMFVQSQRPQKGGRWGADGRTSTCILKTMMRMIVNMQAGFHDNILSPRMHSTSRNVLCAV